MAPSKTTNSWDDDEDSDSTPPSSPPVVARRGKFDDEEDDGDVLESWDAAEDSEVEREKAKKAAEAKAKAEAEAKANHKSKSQRIAEKREANMRRLQEEDESSEEEETEAERRARMAESEKASDLKNAEDLFGGIRAPDKSRSTKAVTVQEGDDPSNAIDLTKLKLFSPTTAPQFAKLRETLVPLVGQNSKRPHYALFMQEFTKQLAKDMNSEQIKKLSSALSTMSNEKMKEEKAAEKGGKKSKAAKTKTTLAANKDVSAKADMTNYDDGLDDDDFM